MRFMIIVKATKKSEAGVMPEEQLIAEMARHHEELAKAGVLLDGTGLQPSSKGWRIKYTSGKRTVVDGPFAETKELIAGYTLIQTKSRGARVVEALSQSRHWRQGLRDRGAPAVRAGGFRSERSRRALSRHGDWQPEVE